MEMVMSAMGTERDFRDMIQAAAATETRLPAARPLTMTTHFVWVLLTCSALLVSAPLVAAWAASMWLR